MSVFRNLLGVFIQVIAEILFLLPLMKDLTTCIADITNKNGPLGSKPSTFLKLGVLLRGIAKF